MLFLPADSKPSTEQASDMNKLDRMERKFRREYIAKAGAVCPCVVCVLLKRYIY